MTVASVAAAVDSCKDALRSLREEKVALIETVLALKAKDRAHWEARRLNETQRIAAVRIRIENANTQGDAALAAVLQQRLAGNVRKLDEHQTRIALAITSEAELRAMLSAEQRQLARLGDGETTTSDEEAEANDDEPTNQVEELREESELVRQMRSLSFHQDNNAANA